MIVSVLFLCLKQKTAYDVRISDWSSDVCSSDLGRQIPAEPGSESKARQPRGKRYARVDTACGKIGEEQAARRCGNHDDQQGAGIDGAIALKSGKKLGNDEYRKERAEAEKG